MAPTNQNDRDRAERAEAALRDREEQLRRRIARDIHDQLGQQMTALRLQLEALLARTGDAQPGLAGRVGKAQQLANELDQSIDFLTWELTPTVLDHLGLVNALGHLVPSVLHPRRLPGSGRRRHPVAI